MDENVLRFMKWIQLFLTPTAVIIHALLLYQNICMIFNIGICVLCALCDISWFDSVFCICWEW